MAYFPFGSRWPVATIILRGRTARKSGVSHGNREHSPVRVHTEGRDIFIVADEEALLVELVREGVGGRRRGGGDPDFVKSK